MGKWIYRGEYVMEDSNKPTVDNVYNEGLRLITMALYTYCRTTNTPMYNAIRNIVVKDLQKSYDLNKEALRESYDNAGSEVQDDNQDSETVQ